MLLNYFAPECLPRRNKSKGGLQRRGHKEAPFLSELENIAQSGVTRADRYLARYHGEWGGSVAPLFRDAIF